MFVYFWRHFPTGKQGAKQAIETNLSPAGRKYGRQCINRYFPSTPPFKEINSSKLTRANESAYLIANHRKQQTPIPVVSNELFDEWNITKQIGGKPFDQLEKEKYFVWRQRVFQELQIDLKYKGCDSLIDLCHKFVQGLDYLARTPEDKIVVTHSQYIAAGLSTIALGLKPEPEDLVLAFQYFFPKLHGTVAILKYENGIWSIENKSYTDHLPK